MAIDLYKSHGTPDFSQQIDLLRKLEPPHQFGFLLQVTLVFIGSLAAFFLAGWWICVVWATVYLTLQLSEKLIVRLIPGKPPLHHYVLVLVILGSQASVYCFMPIYLWFLGPDIAKFGSLILITASTMHTMLHRAAFPSILLCFLIPDAAVFAIISGDALVMYGPTNEAILYAVGGVTISAFFFSTFLQAYLRETKSRQETAEHRVVQTEKEASEIRFKSLFENAPIPIREEDLSGPKKLIDGLNLTDTDEFSAYLDEHPEFVEACSKELSIIDVNRASLEQHAYKDKTEMLANVVRTLSPDALKIVRLSLEAMHRGARGISYETQIKRADGSIRNVAGTWSVIPGHEDTYSRILLCSLDMTDRRKSEETLRQAQKMEAVGQLTGGIAHDFNNLLTVVGGNIDLMEAGTEFDPKLAAPIRNAVDRGAELTQRLLAFSRKQPLTAKPISLDTLVLKMNDLLARSLGEEIIIETSLWADPWLAFADQGQVEASLLNLTLNSRDAMPTGGKLTISTSKVSIEPDDDTDLDTGDYVVLAVSDTGTGMTPDVLARAYEPFFTTKEVGKGTGLGLPSVYGFAKQSGGEVQIKSDPGVETKVSLYLPRSQSPTEEEDNVPASTQRINGEGLCALLLEDDPGIRRYISTLVRSNGFDVLTAGDAVSAQKIVDSGARIDLLISDVMLPGGVRGPEFATQLIATSGNIGIVFISGRPLEAHLDEYPNLASQTILQKPFTRDQLLQQIEHALNGRM